MSGLSPKASGPKPTGPHQPKRGSLKCAAEPCDAELPPKGSVLRKLACVIFAEVSNAHDDDEFAAMAAVMKNRMGAGYRKPAFGSIDKVLGETYGKGEDKHFQFNALDNGGSAQFKKCEQCAMSKGAACEKLKKAIEAANRVASNEKVPKEYESYKFWGAKAGCRNPEDGTQHGGTLFGPKPFRY